MRVPPMIAALGRHRLTCWLLVLQAAVTCAVVCNAAFMVTQRVQRVNEPSGLRESGLSIMSLSLAKLHDDQLAQYLGDVDALRRIPGVQAAALVDGVPYLGGESSGTTCGSLDAVRRMLAARADVPGCAEPVLYSGGRQVLQALGLTLVAGRDFRDGDYVHGKAGYQMGDASSVIVSQSLARRLYPEGNAVGQMVYFGAGLSKGQGQRIVGVVEHLQRGILGKAIDDDQAVLVPSEPADASVLFALRSAARDQRRVLAAAAALLDERHPDRLQDPNFGRPYAQVRAAYFQRDRTMIGLLIASALGLLFVTALGIAGLANFWVQQRTRSIGIRRAIGATRGDILRYFQAENFLIVGVGIVLGMLLALALNLWLMQQYELTRLPWPYLPVGALLLWLLGQGAVLAPALRAAAVPPVVATRTI
ncbi:MAG: ABC transporter permease [Rhodanobacter sp.]